MGEFILDVDAVVIDGAVGSVSREYQFNAWQEGLVIIEPTLAAIVGMINALVSLGVQFVFSWE